MLRQCQAGEEDIAGDEIRAPVRARAFWTFLRKTAGFFRAAAVNDDIKSLLQQVAGKAAAHGPGTPESDFHEFALLYTFGADAP